MKKAAIIVAAGSGSRMGGAVPKQYLELAGKPLIIHTLEKFRTFDPEIILVLVVHPEKANLWEVLAHSYEVAGKVILTHGGARRYDSVKNGLAHIENGIITGIHDAVRPLVSQDTLKRTYDAATHNGSGIPVIEMEDSVRMREGLDGSKHMDRSKLVRVQTPQVFRSEQIKQAYKQDFDPAFTDDASVYESLFGEVCLVEGNRENIKITTPTDFQLASLLISPRE